MLNAIMAVVMNGNCVRSFAMLKRVLFSALAIPLIGVFEPAQATYDTSCMEQLEKTHLQLKAVAFVRFEWEIIFSEIIGIKKPTDLEFEAIMDVIHELPLIVRFANGQEFIFDD